VISAEEFVERLCKSAADRGPRSFPRAARDRQILMQSIVLCLDSARTYNEREIDAALKAWKREVGPAIETDHVTLRRLLVDYGRLERTPDGACYRVGFPPRSVAFALAVYDLDLRATVAAYLEYQRHRRREQERKRGRSSQPGSASSPGRVRTRPR
jgi:hypothetical protein